MGQLFTTLQKFDASPVEYHDNHSEQSAQLKVFEPFKGVFSSHFDRLKDAEQVVKEAVVYRDCDEWESRFEEIGEGMPEGEELKAL